MKSTILLQLLHLVDKEPLVLLERLAQLDLQEQLVAQEQQEVLVLQDKQDLQVLLVM
jgi:hypothetical protein